MRVSGIGEVSLALILASGAAKPILVPAANSAATPATVAPALINTCLITSDVEKLTKFYERVLQIAPQKSGDNYVEFRTTAGTLALFSAAAQEKYIPGSATAGQNRSAILEFRVANVDAEYARLHDVVKWVKGPTTQPWGTRSICFRDPDDNLVDFFMPPPLAGRVDH
jgi:catechol 2,3-dioxygenase-like lactoylglutathione lyase family enzyme